jgi:hypothetical protein
MKMTLLAVLAGLFCGACATVEAPRTLRFTKATCEQRDCLWDEKLERCACGGVWGEAQQPRIPGGIEVKP